MAKTKIAKILALIREKKIDASKRPVLVRRDEPDCWLASDGLRDESLGLSSSCCWGHSFLCVTLTMGAVVMWDYCPINYKVVETKLFL